MLKKMFTVATIILSTQATNCWAQTSSLDRAFLQSPQARATITIPFGAHPSARKDKPRLEFGIRRYHDRPTYDWILGSGVTRNSDAHRLGYMESKVGFTLSKETALLLNGHAVSFTDPESADVSDEVKTAGKIALGAGVVVVAVVAVSLVLIATQTVDNT